jgi:hypothetical protein
MRERIVAALFAMMFKSRLSWLGRARPNVPETGGAGRRSFESGLGDQIAERGREVSGAANISPAAAVNLRLAFSAHRS